MAIYGAGVRRVLGLGALVRGQFVKKMEPKAWLVEPDWVASQKARWKYESDAGFISLDNDLTPKESGFAF